MNRRQFLKRLLAASALCAVPVKLLASKLVIDPSLEVYGRSPAQYVLDELAAFQQRLYVCQSQYFDFVAYGVDPEYLCLTQKVPTDFSGELWEVWESKTTQSNKSSFIHEQDQRDASANPLECTQKQEL